MLLHLENAVKQMHTVDSDALVVAGAAAHRLNNSELWIILGVGNYFHYLPAHEIAKALAAISQVSIAFAVAIALLYP